MNVEKTLATLVNQDKASPFAKANFSKLIELIFGNLLHKKHFGDKNVWPGPWLESMDIIMDMRSKKLY